MNVENDNKETKRKKIEIFEGDDLEVVATKFCNKYGLNNIEIKNILIDEMSK